MFITLRRDLEMAAEVEVIFYSDYHESLFTRYQEISLLYCVALFPLGTTAGAFFLHSKALKIIHPHRKFIASCSELRMRSYLRKNK